MEIERSEYGDFDAWTNAGSSSPLPGVAIPFEPISDLQFFDSNTFSGLKFLMKKRMNNLVKNQYNK